MRTKPVEAVLRLDVVALEPRPAIYLSYDGLAGLSQRPILRDLMRRARAEGDRGGTEVPRGAPPRHRSAQVHVYFSDYVSYGIGGGDAAAEFFLGTFLLLHEPARPAGKEAAVPEHLALFRAGGSRTARARESADLTARSERAIFYRPPRSPETDHGRRHPLEAERRAKVARLRASGREPYPWSFPDRVGTDAVRAACASLDPGRRAGSDLTARGGALARRPVSTGGPRSLTSRILRGRSSSS